MIRNVHIGTCWLMVMCSAGAGPGPQVLDPIIVPLAFKKWPGNTVPYQLSNTFNATYQRQIRAAMDYFEDHSCVTFVKRNSEEDYLDIVATMKERGKPAPYTHTSGRSCLVMSPDHLMQRGRSLLFLVLGFTPEHLRGDRDDYIRLNDIEALEVAPSLQKRDRVYDIDVKFSYDGLSLSHIGTNDLASLGASMVALDPARTKFNAKWEGLSEIDKQKLAHFYNCTAKTYEDSGFEGTEEVPESHEETGEQDEYKRENKSETKEKINEDTRVKTNYAVQMVAEEQTKEVTKYEHKGVTISEVPDSRHTAQGSEKEFNYIQDIVEDPDDQRTEQRSSTIFAWPFFIGSAASFHTGTFSLLSIVIFHLCVFLYVETMKL